MPSHMTKNYKCLAGSTLSDSADQEISIFNYLCKINTSNEDWIEFDKYANNLNLDIVAMCNDIVSYNFSKKMKIAAHVLSAGCFGELELINKIVLENDKIIIRIGGATLSEIDDTIKHIFSVKKDIEINLLAGVQLYPTPIDQLHLKSLEKIKNRYRENKISIGIADHIDGDHKFAKFLPGLALAYNVKIIEKHITTNRREKLEDYEAALGLEQFKEFVEFIRTCETALGAGSINYLKNDTYEKYRNVVRKKIVANRPIKKNEIIKKSDLTFKRADYGASVFEYNKIIGKKLKNSKSYEDGISLNDIFK